MDGREQKEIWRESGTESEHETDNFCQLIIVSSCSRCTIPLLSKLQKSVNVEILACSGALSLSPETKMKQKMKFELASIFCFSYFRLQSQTALPFYVEKSKTLSYVIAQCLIGQPNSEEH